VIPGPLAALARRFSRRGFVGPRFEGWRGRLRFVFQELVWRRDVMLVATPASAVPPASAALEPGLTLDYPPNHAALAPLAATLDAEYFPGFTARLREPFEWGETLVLLRNGERVLGFAWLQRGSPAGTPYYAGVLMPGDVRVLRVGVVPSQRRRGYLTALLVLLLQELFRTGASRVVAECSRDNLPSLRGFRAAGYQPVGELTVLGPLLGRFIRWERFRPTGDGA
jgi:RimJ/RimL family protein N-acetyltransferase